jgi:outer membrane lipoprotein-sorting protein
MKIKYTFLSILFCSLVNAAPTADEVLKQAEKYRGLDENYVVTVQVTNQMGNSIQDESTFTVYIKDNTTSLVEQVSPASARGKKLLMVNNDLWMRTNDIKKAIRINLDQKLTGEAANGDLAKTNFYTDYEPTIVEETPTYYKLHLKSKHNQTTYQQINYFISKTGYIPLKAEFMALSGKILKNVEYAKPDKKIKNRTLITKIKISDAIVKQRASILKYSQFKVKKIDDVIFNRASM